MGQSINIWQKHTFQKGVGFVLESHKGTAGFLASEVNKPLSHKRSWASLLHLRLDLPDLSFHQ